MIIEKHPAESISAWGAFLFMKLRLILHYIFDPAIKCSAKLVKRLGLNILIGFKTANRFTVNSALLTKLIGRYAFFFHCFPKLIEYDHFYSASGISGVDTILTNLTSAICCLDFGLSFFPVLTDAILSSVP